MTQDPFAILRGYVGEGNREDVAMLCAEILLLLYAVLHRKSPHIIGFVMDIDRAAENKIRNAHLSIELLIGGGQGRKCLHRYAIGRLPYDVETGASVGQAIEACVQRSKLIQLVLAETVGRSEFFANGSDHLCDGFVVQGDPAFGKAYAIAIFRYNRGGFRLRRLCGCRILQIPAKDLQMAMGGDPAPPAAESVLCRWRSC